MSRVSMNCLKEGCEKLKYCRGMCKTHYRKWVDENPDKKRKSILPRVYPAPPILQSVLDRVVAGHNNCWVYIGFKNKKGYGSFLGKWVHRVTYQEMIGPIPDGFDIDHLCKNRSCCNPAHLEPVTHQENVRRGDTGNPQRGRTHCPSGHEYSKENTKIEANGSRSCRTCKRMSHLKRRNPKKYALLCYPSLPCAASTLEQHKNQ